MAKEIAAFLWRFIKGDLARDVYDIKRKKKLKQISRIRKWKSRETNSELSKIY